MGGHELSEHRKSFHSLETCSFEEGKRITLRTVLQTRFPSEVYTLKHRAGPACPIASGTM